MKMTSSGLMRRRSRILTTVVEGSGMGGRLKVILRRKKWLLRGCVCCVLGGREPIGEDSWDEDIP